MRYTSTKRYGRARTAQRPRWQPDVWWVEDIWGVRSVRQRHYEATLISLDDTTGLATVRFRNGRTRQVPLEQLHPAETAPTTGHLIRNHKTPLGKKGDDKTHA